jgi:hypothetical protein
MNIHYRTDTGKIVSWDTASSASNHDNASHLPGCKIVGLDDYVPIDPKAQKIDVTTRRLVELTAEEKALAAMPTAFDVKAAILTELTATDSFANVPSDRPRVGALALDWLPYRQTLRDLSKLPTPVAMVKAWPVRPDGADAIAELRARLAG